MTDERSLLGRAVAILAAFEQSTPTTPTLTDIAARTGLPMTTVHRLCGQLVGERLLERTPDGGFRVGLRLWELGMLAPRSQALRDVALPFLEDLFEVTRQHVQLMVLDGGDAVVVERLSAPNAVRLQGRAGGRLPIHATSGGIAMLAFGGPAAQTRVATGELTAYTPQTIRTEAELRAALATTRQQGFVELREAVTPGSISIAAPVLVGDREPLAAVSVIVAADTDTRMLAPAIRTTARAIARALGRGVTTADR